MKALLSTTLVFASLMLSVAAEARTIYWTGYGSTPQAAVNDGNNGVRNDCVVNKGVQAQVCYSAPITQIDDMGMANVLLGYDWQGYPIYQLQYVRRVYIYLP